MLEISLSSEKKMYQYLHTFGSKLLGACGSLVCKVNGKVATATNNALYESCLAVVKKKMAHILGHNLEYPTEILKPESAVRMDFTHNVNIKLDNDSVQLVTAAVVLSTISAGMCMATCIRSCYRKTGLRFW